MNFGLVGEESLKVICKGKFSSPLNLKINHSDFFGSAGKRNAEFDKNKREEDKY